MSESRHEPEMFDPDNPRYVSEWDYSEAEREKDIREFHEASALDPYELELSIDDIGDLDDYDEDRELFTKLHEIEEYSWIEETVVQGRTVPISVAKLKREAATQDTAYAVAVNYKSTRLDFILQQRLSDGIMIFASESPRHFDLIDTDIDELLSGQIKPDWLRGLDTPDQAARFTAYVLPALILSLERGHIMK